MKIRKLLEKAQALLDPKERKSKAQKKIQEGIDLAHAQRKKGLKVLKSLKNI